MKLSNFILLFTLSFSYSAWAEMSDHLPNRDRMDAFLERVAERVDISIDDARQTFCGEDGCRGKVRDIVKDPENRKKFKQLLSRAKQRLSIYGQYIRAHLKDCHGTQNNSDSAHLSPFSDYTRAPASQTEPAVVPPTDTTAPAVVAPE